MNEELSFLLGVIGAGSVFAPFIFILFHLLRQFLFIPVAVVCVAGGILFGPTAGTVYSIMGLTLASFIFFFMINRFPKMLERLLNLKNCLEIEISMFHKLLYCV
ncbi:hypothetical protein [Bacillus sp. V5-8f]|uniref:hypothetical protein n=1 Tax=Bacillus sp. V5-8f TaxID=2053044 RepID=UPI0026A4B788|nr:hypothetical protein [Bacillus sp. V5-8f]